MATLAVAAVLILLLTAVMLAVEEYDRMRERARESLHRERLANARGEEQRTYWDDQRQRTIERCERELESAVEDLRVDLELYGPDGFLWLDSETEQRRSREEEA